MARIGAGQTCLKMRTVRENVVCGNIYTVRIAGDLSIAAAFPKSVLSIYVPLCDFPMRYEFFTAASDQPSMKLTSA